jgi:hypothetical protein
VAVVAAPAAGQAHERQGAAGRPAGDGVDADAEQRGSRLRGQQQGVVVGWAPRRPDRRPAIRQADLGGLDLTGEHRLESVDLDRKYAGAQVGDRERGDGLPRRDEALPWGRRCSSRHVLRFLRARLVTANGGRVLF